MNRTFPFLIGGVLIGAGACSDFAMEPTRTPAALQVSPDTVVLTEGDTVAFQVTVMDADGTPYETLPGWAPPYWTSSNEAVLAVSGGGVGQTLSAGESRAGVELAGLETEAVVRTNPRELQVEVAFAYVTQGVQRQGGGVPLVADRDGLLRVYLMGDGPNFFQPEPVATFYRGGAAVYTTPLELEGAGIPDQLDEGQMQWSFNRAVPGSVLQPGTSLVVELDPSGVVPMTAGSETRIPATGELALDVRTVPPFRVTMVPVNQTYSGLNSGISQSSAERDLELSREIWPFAEFDVSVRADYTTDLDLSVSDGWYALIQDIYFLRLDDGSPNYYYGGFERPGGVRLLGLGYVGYPVSIGDEAEEGTIAHELGHNLNLPHAPCGGPANPDPRYPYPDGSTGVYGWEPSTGFLMRPDQNFDLMTYCDPIWVSDYNYERVLAHRDTSAHDAALATAPARGRAGLEAGLGERSLVITGGLVDGTLTLGPALPSRAAPTAPAPGPYTLEGVAADGSILFSRSLRPQPVDHGGALFGVAVALEEAQPDRLARLRLTGPDGTVERSRSDGPAVAPPELIVEDSLAGARSVFPEGRWDTAAYPLALIRDRSTGDVRAVARSGRIALPTADLDRLDVVLSDGVATHPARLVRR